MTSASLPTVDIALATYNGERFLAPFLDSLVAQTHEKIVLVVSDDGSTDRTAEILESYRDRLEIRFLGSARRGVVGNFERALAGCDADYVVLADQDDIWRADKIERLVATAMEVERVTGRDQPVLVFSDLGLVTETLEVIAPSFFDATLKSIEARTLTDFALDNHAPGCCTLANRTLLDLALPFPEVTIHDWWINLLAAAAGTVAACPESLVDYRQHGGNAIGIGSAAASDASKLRAVLTRPWAFIGSRIANARKRADVARTQLAALRLRLNERGRSVASRDVDPLMRSGMAELSKIFAGARPGLRRFDLALTLFFLGRRNRSALPAIETRDASDA
ncbi:glycosyltransferase family 2 protein [Brevundimonas goettingensis]|uniref:Glycosyltransferase family 2 protein n=1 Tax=Brevundimonas goettingensis TaxID=2774190 RepID=A0A975C4M6_9CAUL|nr:glycosyltransferase family 2 protein [Brevundimonas goettingensis]QTC91477.1 glycosyltransferase family 2 protein [Brevundimonas goettingensis]